jgi:hypothetical protein
MTNKQHTAGAWRFHNGTHIPTVIATTKDGVEVTVATCSTSISVGINGSYHIDDEEAAANARLIAAAPKMLTLLKLQSKILALLKELLILDPLDAEKREVILKEINDATTLP